MNEPDSAGQYTYDAEGNPATREELAIYQATGAVSDHEQLMLGARADLNRNAVAAVRSVEAIQEAHHEGDARAQGHAEQAAQKAIAELSFAVSYLGYLRIRESERQAAKA